MGKRRRRRRPSRNKRLPPRPFWEIKLPFAIDSRFQIETTVVFRLVRRRFIIAFSRQTPARPLCRKYRVTARGYVRVCGLSRAILRRPSHVSNRAQRLRDSKTRRSDYVKHGLQIEKRKLNADLGH